MIGQAFERSFFDPAEPLRWLERCFNPFTHSETVSLNGRALEIAWTGRADRALRRREQPLRIHLQLMFPGG